MAQDTCTIDGCTNLIKNRTNGWCDAHYWRYRKHGDPHHGGPINHMHRDPESAFAARTERRGTCLLWTGSKNDRGYGKLQVRGRLTYAHVYAWERENGEVPEGMDVDHRYHCDLLCCEVTHLRLADRSDNLSNRSGARSNRLHDLPRNVYYSTRSGRYFVRIQRRGAPHHIGTYDSVTEAVEAADRARRDLFGEFAGRG